MMLLVTQERQNAFSPKRSKHSMEGRGAMLKEGIGTTQEPNLVHTEGSFRLHAYESR